MTLWVTLTLTCATCVLGLPPPRHMRMACQARATSWHGRISVPIVTRRGWESGWHCRDHTASACRVSPGMRGQIDWHSSHFTPLSLFHSIQLAVEPSLHNRHLPSSWMPFCLLLKACDFEGRILLLPFVWSWLPINLRTGKTKSLGYLIWP